MSGGWHSAGRTISSGFPGGGGYYEERRVPHWVVGCSGSELLVTATLVPIANINAAIRDCFSYRRRVQELSSPLPGHWVSRVLERSACGFDNRNQFLIVDEKKIAHSPRSSGHITADLAEMVVEHLTTVGILFDPAAKSPGLLLRDHELEAWVASARLFFSASE